MPPITLLVISAGSRGANYAEYAHWYPDQAQVVGVAEPREHYRSWLATRHGIPAANVYADWREAADRPRFADAVILSGPAESLETHLMVFAAEQARREGQVVSLSC